MIREPAVSGLFYPDKPDDLKSEIKKYIDEVPKSKVEKVLGIISPHAGYSYSGKAAAYSHKALFDSGYSDTLILLGPSHSSAKSSVWLGSDWATPIGKVEIDRELGREISESKLFDINPDPHFQEHSLEVQLPFIQYLSENPPKIVPILFSSPVDVKLAEKYADAIYSKIKDKNVKFVISSDFTHYGINYDYLPFMGLNVKEKIHDLDKGAIKKIEELDVEGFVDYVKETGATICGAFPICVAIVLAKKLGSKKAELLNYYTSGDLTGSYSNSVSYAAMYF